MTDSLLQMKIYMYLKFVLWLSEIYVIIKAVNDLVLNNFAIHLSKFKDKNIFLCNIILTKAHFTQIIKIISFI